jgi:class 3 adenylate cyclase
MDFIDTHYASARDGTLIAYQLIGAGPVDIFELTDWPGNIDMELEDPEGKVWYPTIASFSRLILHDRRGTGLSSRNVDLPNLETRASDILAVMDAIGSERPVILGLSESGSPGALLAATQPERVRSLVWYEPNPRFAWAPDYPWGRTSEDMENELRDIGLWGTLAYGQAFVVDETARGNPGPDDWAVHIAKASRNSCTPDVARELSKIWYETDVRGVLPAIQVPTLIAARSDQDVLARSRYVASLIPGAEFKELSGGDVLSYEEILATADEVRRFVGIDRTPTELDTVLSTVLFTDIVDSTSRAATLGDANWRDLLARHDDIAGHAIEQHRGRYVKHTGDGLIATFDGPARAVRCASAIGGAVRQLGLEIRAGVHTGEIKFEGEDVRGIAVHIGARVMALANPSEVLVSSTVKDLVAGSGLTFEDGGEHELKGIPDRWHLYRVREQSQ